MSAYRQLPIRAQCGPVSLHSNSLSTWHKLSWHLFTTSGQACPCLSLGLGAPAWLGIPGDLADTRKLGRGRRFFFFNPIQFSQRWDCSPILGEREDIQDGRLSPQAHPPSCGAERPDFGTQDNHPGPPAPPTRLCPYSAWMSCLCCQGNLPSLAVTPLELDSCT